MTNYWKDKSVVVLGGAGFIGSHLTDALFKLVNNVIVVDDFSSGEFRNVPKEVKCYQLDLRNFGTCVSAVRNSDVVFHLASDVGGRAYLNSNKAELWGNLELDAAIFRACSYCKDVKKVVFFSSACAYPNVAIPYFDEDMIDYSRIEQADGVYGMEKLIGEHMLGDFSGDFQGISVRPFTVYGPRMKENRSIGALIAKTFIQQEPFEVWGTGHQRMDWIYVKDLVRGVLLATENMDNGVVNMGTGMSHTPLDALKIIWEYVGWKPKEIVYRTDMPTSPVKIAETSKLHSLGWSMDFTFKQGLWDTIDWYYETHSVKDVRENLERKLLER